MTIAELLADEFDSDWDKLTADQQQLAVIDAQGIADEDGVSDSEAVRTMRRRLGNEAGILERYITTLQVGAAKEVAQRDLIPESPYGIICEYHDRQGLSKDEYIRQMNKPDSFWQCPIRGCPGTAVWDDDRYEKGIEEGKIS